MANFISILFIFLSLIVVYFYWRKSNFSQWVLVSALLAIVSHHVLSGYNIIYGPLPVAALDAYSFHLHGIQRVDIPEYKTWSIGSDIYKSLLASVYGLFGKSLWLGQSFSIIFYAFSCIALMYFAKLLRLNNTSSVIAILCFGLLPSSLLYASFTLREPLFTAFFMLGVLAGFQSISFDERSKQWQMWVLATICFIIMGTLHMVLLVYAIVVSGILFLVLFKQRSSWQQLVFVMLVGVGVVALILLAMKELLPANLADDYFAMLRIQIDGEVVPLPQAISIYHQTANETGASTQYSADLEFKTWGRMFIVFIYSYIFYMGWPLTGDYFQLSTLVIFCEAAFRLLGVACLVCLVLKKPKNISTPHLSSQWFWLMLVYFSLSFLWNIGTSNHGQALRHHYMTEWILILAIVYFFQKVKSK